MFCLLSFLFPNEEEEEEEKEEEEEDGSFGVRRLAAAVRVATWTNWKGLLK